ncbi:hypothetical protein [Paenibacillus sp. A14]|uniref:hypothetical protein n=1 Tax=Paenibacillus sp. A14 TaxID=3119820 RepID=UPI002FE3DD5F
MQKVLAVKEEPLQPALLIFGIRGGRRFSASHGAGFVLRTGGASAFPAFAEPAEQSDSGENKHGAGDQNICHMKKLPSRL